VLQNKNYLDAVMNLMQQAEKPGALTTKEKELISVALGIAAHCDVIALQYM